jgi:hypothetical protein
MSNKDELATQIRFAFGNADFPSHCGWNAAIAKDYWISDPKELLRITNIKDIKGQWWEIPFNELDNCSMAQCYLDAKGVAFYLPAYMTGIVKQTIRPHYCHLISWLTPGVNDCKANLYDYFIKNFSLIDNSRKKVCVDVLKYILSNLDPNDMFSEKEIRDLLQHEFWSKES